MHPENTSPTYAIGIDVGGSSLKCGLVKNTGKIVYKCLKPISNADTQESVIALVCEAISECAVHAPNAEVKIGVGFPGIVDNNIIIGGADNLPGFENLPLGNILQQQTGFTVVVDNDANMMGLGELTFGAAKGCSDIIFITVGTGIGGAIVINKKIFGGYNNRGGELGHIVLQHNGEPCTCGSKGCFEAYASVTALIYNYKNLSKSVTADGKCIISKYLKGDANAIAVMHHHFDYMAAGIATLINIFSPQKIVIGGGISEAGDFYIQEIETRIQHIAMPAAFQHTSIVGAELGNEAGLVGCAAKAFAM